MRWRALTLGLGVAFALPAAQAAADADAPRPAVVAAPAGAPGDPAGDGAGDRARAREAYDRGAAAHQRGDHGTEARELALADAIVPNAVTLHAALEAALEADDAVLAMTLVERARRAPAEGSLTAAAQRARARFSRRVGHVRVECGGASACAATVDGSPVEAGRSVVARVGPHAVSVRRDGQLEQRRVEVEPEGTAILLVPGAAAAPLDPVAPPARLSRTPSPGWFIAALGSTVIAAGVTIGLAVDTASRHDAFVGAGCAGQAHGDCAALASDGMAAQARTNALLGVTAALGAATVAAAVLTFRGRGPAGAPRASLAVGAGPVAVLRVPVP